MAALWLYGQPETLAPQQGQWVDRFRGFQERDRAAAMSAARVNAELAAQQQQADEAAMQRDFANRVDLSRYANNQAFAERAEVENTRRFNVGTNLSEKQIEAYKGLRESDRTDRADARTQSRWANLQTLLMNRQVRTLDEAKTYVDWTPENVVRVQKLLDRANDENVKHQLFLLKSNTASTQAAQTTDAIKALRANNANATIPNSLRADAAKLHPDTLKMLRQSIEDPDPRIRWDYTKEDWTTEKEPAKLGMGDVRMTDRDIDLTRFAPMAAPRLSPPAVLVGRGGATVTDFSERPIGTQAEYASLPKGARFVWVYPDGRRRAGVKP